MSHFPDLTRQPNSATFTTFSSTTTPTTAGSGHFSTSPATAIKGRQ